MYKHSTNNLQYWFLVLILWKLQSLLQSLLQSVYIVLIYLRSNWRENMCCLSLVLTVMIALETTHDALKSLSHLMHLLSLMKKDLCMLLAPFFCFIPQSVLGGRGLFGRNARSFAVCNLISSVGCHTAVKQMEFYTVVSVFCNKCSVMLSFVRTWLKWF